MALVDADYKFILVDIGPNGFAPDAAIFNQVQVSGFKVARHYKAHRGYPFSTIQKWKRSLRMAP